MLILAVADGGKRRTSCGFNGSKTNVHIVIHRCPTLRQLPLSLGLKRAGKRKDEGFYVISPACDR